MRRFRILHSFLRNQHHFHNNNIVTQPTRIFGRYSQHYIPSPLNDQKVCQVYTEKVEDDNEDEYPLLENEQFDENQVKHILFKNSEDNIIKELNQCTSIEGVWKTMNEYKHDYGPEHITQTVLVLNDLQSVYCALNKSQEDKFNVFLSILNKHKEFSELLNTVKKHYDDFDSVLLSYLLLYLQKLGFSVESEVMQNLSLKLRDELLEKFSLDECAKLLKVIFTDNSVRPYYISLDLIPKICHSIDKIQCIDDLENLTICLNKLHNTITKEILENYKDKIQQFIKEHKFNKTNQRAILRIIMFLNYPEWRHKNIKLTSECILLLKNRLHLLDISELLLLYEVFFKIQEPGDILNEIQRCAANFWQNFEDNSGLDISTNLKLFTSLLYFSSPMHKIQFQEEAATLLRKCNDIGTLLILQKIFSFVKISDRNVCKEYWNLSMEHIGSDTSVKNIVKLCQNYMQFSSDVDNFRHRNFERKILEFIQQSVKRNDIISPSDFAVIVMFTVIYGNDTKLSNLLMRKLETSFSQFSENDCFKMSKNIGMLSEVDNNFISKRHIEKVKELLNQQTRNILALANCDFHKSSVLIKAAMLRNDYDDITIDNLFIKFKEMDYMSSKMLEVFSQLILYTGNLVPEIINKCTEYIVERHTNIIGFNAEKILHLCYHLAYYPINADKFFKVVTDIIIRDQERFSGLTFLQSAHSLCFFNKLPSFLVKQIFNVEFMDRLDSELANCYNKDEYPQRVRTMLMFLNRSVCLDYPEFNIPWFHKMYVQEMERKYKREQGENHRIRIKEYLSKLAGNSKNISENIVTPYGYHIDFVINLDKENKIVPAESEEIRRKVALLLVHQKAFTRFYIHLKGKYQMKKRHLEILGYGVSFLNFNEWSNLLYSIERIDYLTELIWPKNSEPIKNGRER